MKSFRIKRIVAAALAATMIMSECAYASELDVLNGITAVSADTVTEDEVSAVPDEAAGDVTVEEIDLEDSGLGDEVVLGDEETPEPVSDIGEAVSSNTVSENEAEELDEGISANEVSMNVIEEEEPLSADEAAQMFPGFSKVLSKDAQILDRKREVAVHLSDGSTGGIEGVDFVEGQILVNADTREQAEEYAAAFNGTVLKYDFDLACIELNADDSLPKATVMDAVRASAYGMSALPAAWPNHYRYIDTFDTDEYDEVEEDEYENDEDENEDEDDDDVEYVAVPEGDPAEDDRYYYADEYNEDGSPVEYYDEEGNIVEEGVAVTGIANDRFLKPNCTWDIWEQIGVDNNKKPLYGPVTENAYQWHHNLLGSRYAWQADYYGSGSRVCVIDTGINSHNDINSPVKSAYYNNNAGLADRNGHGSNVAGIIASKNNNTIGGSGVAPETQLYVINASDEEGSFETYDVINAIDRASKSEAEGGFEVDIINMSLGGAFYNGSEAAAVKRAYDRGVAVFCAAGNEATSAVHYPAGYPGAISIGAVGKGNKKASFSNSRGVAFSGPGVEIYSISYAGSDRYSVMQGTSQATPCISGVAAVLLGSGKVAGGKRTVARVENLKKLMQKGCIKSGLGKGTPNLAKCLGLKTATAKPNKPGINVTPGTYQSRGLSFALKADAGTQIYYTTDGSKPKYKNGMISANARRCTGTFTVEDVSKITVKAIAISDTSKLASKVATFKYTLKPKVQGITINVKNGINAVQKGGSLQLSASFNPVNVANKKLKWSLAASYPGVTINSKTGLVKVAKTVTVANFAVFAEATDGSGVKSVNFPINVKDGQVTSIKAASKKVTLYNGKTAAVKVTVKGKTGTIPASSLSINTSNSSVATASATSADTITVTGRGAGKATITLAATDGSGKTATIKVTGKQYISEFSISGLSAIAQGRGFTPGIYNIKPSATSNKKVKWSLTGVAPGTTIAACGVKVNAKKGTVTTKANTPTGPYTITATAADGSNVKRTYSFNVTPASQRVSSIKINGKSTTIFRVQNAYNSPISKSVTFTAMRADGTAAGSTLIDIKSSKPNLVEVINVNNTGFTVRVKRDDNVNGNGTGTAIITVSSKDGTNIKKKFKVTVVNPPSAVRLSVPSGRSNWLARGKSMKLKAEFETDYGPISKASKKLKFTSSSPSYVSVSGKGKVKAKTNSSSDWVSIDAVAKDGSGVKAKYKIRCCVPFLKFVLNTKKVTISRGGSYPVYAKQMKVAFRDVFGEASYEYGFKVNKAGLGIVPLVDQGYADYGAYVVGNKKGKYKVTMYTLDGGKAKASFTVRVK